MVMLLYLIQIEIFYLFLSYNNNNHHHQKTLWREEIAGRNSWRNKKKICPAFEKSEDKNNSNWKRFLQLHPRNKETEWGRVEEETFFFFFFGIQSIDITCMWINCPSVSESFNCHHTTVDSIIYLKKKNTQTRKLAI